MKRFFGGNSVGDGGGIVRQLEAHSWEEFVARYIQIPHLINHTRVEYFTFDKDKRDSIKNGPYFCSCSFVDTEVKRSNATADQLQMVSFDLDPPEGTDLRYVKDFCEAPETILEALHPYSCAAYVTANSTPEEPRLRIIVDVQPCDTAKLPSLVAWIAQRLGLPKNFKGLRETRVISQPMFRPVQFLNEESCLSVLCTRTDGQAINADDVPDEIVEELKRTYAYTGEGIEDCGLAFLPIRDLKVEDLREPLFTIDADCNYQTWCEIACSLRHQFTDEEDAHEAFLMFEEWSMTGSKFKDTEPYAKWKSFKPYAENRSPVTVRSLFHHAINAGWNSIKIATSIKKSIEEWINACENEEELMETGCNRISSLPFPNKIIEESLINALRERLGKLTGKPLIKMETIKSQLSSVKATKQKEARTGSIPNWVAPIVFIGPDNLFHNATTGVQYAPAAFDNYFSVKMMPSDNDSEQARSGKPAVMPSAYALNQLNIERVDGTMYSPLNGGEPYFTYRGRRYLNTYLLSSLPAEDSDHSEAAGALFVKHFEELIEQPDYREMVIDYLCHVVQKPGVKIRWMPVIQSGEGAGKGMLAKIMAAVLGKDNVKEVSPDVIQDKWTDWMTGTVLTVLNEVFIPGGTRKAVTNHLKPLLADDRLSITGKYKPVRWEPNETNCLAFTNYFDSFHIDETTRRYMMIESPLQSRDAIDRLVANGHFEKLDILHGAWAGALRHWMMHREIPATFNVNGPAPVTCYLRIMMRESRNKMQVRIEELIADPAYPLFDRDVVALKPMEEETALLSRDSARASHWLRTLGYHPYSDGDLFHIGGITTPVWIKRDYDEDYGPPEEVLALRVAKTSL